MASLPDESDSLANPPVGHPSAKASVAGASLVGIDQSRVKGVDSGLVNLVKESSRFRNQCCPE